MAWAAHREDAFLGARAFLVAPRAAEGEIIAAGIERLLQRVGLHHPVVSDAVVVERVDVVAQAVGVGVYPEIEPEPRRGGVAEGDHVTEFPLRVDVQQRKRQAARKERLARQVQQNRRILADRVEQHRAFRLGHRFPHDVDAFGFQRVEMRRSSRWGHGKVRFDRSRLLEVVALRNAKKSSKATTGGRRSCRGSRRLRCAPDTTRNKASLAIHAPSPKHRRMSGFESRVKAVLGPTNTGKTHLAIERLLAHSSGIIGFPLRLLARENYDRMVARKGARHVALITGEEKIVPPGARWFSRTAEAMPLDRAVEFVAVDEIQLCADPDRGHVFTDRLLHARGLAETMFLGAETIRPLLHRLVPQARVETRPRLSQLSYAGPVKLTKLPPRTAIVAFSAADVYAIAELIRRRRGGCAIVMGRLSPRTRNAQVALYQEKEVDFLVATDAIGMGLNMDVDHVAFAGLTKHDGHRIRRLTAAEVAQIAGRAGRGMHDGTFGTTANCPPLADDVVARVEAHNFDPLEQLCWRNSDLNFGDLDALLASLTASPPRAELVKGNDASDLQTLAALARDADIRMAAAGGRMVRLLWEACQIPDFRKLADETHNRLCARVFFDLARNGRLSDAWLRGQIDTLARPDGDIDTLMQRLAGIRVWSYIAARTDWVHDAPALQAKAREVEDLLSDALHERLTARFVDRRAALLMRRLEETEGG